MPLCFGALIYLIRILMVINKYRDIQIVFVLSIKNRNMLMNLSISATKTQPSSKSKINFKGPNPPNNIIKTAVTNSSALVGTAIVGHILINTPHNPSGEEYLNEIRKNNVSIKTLNNMRNLILNTQNQTDLLKISFALRELSTKKSYKKYFYKIAELLFDITDKTSKILEKENAINFPNLPTVLVNVTTTAKTLAKENPSNLRKFFKPENLDKNFEKNYDELLIDTVEEATKKHNLSAIKHSPKLNSETYKDTLKNACEATGYVLKRDKENNLKFQISNIVEHLQEKNNFYVRFWNETYDEILIDRYVDKEFENTIHSSCEGIKAIVEKRSSLDYAIL